MVEKYGGLWRENELISLAVFREHYDVESDTVQVIYRRNADGFFTVGLFVKTAGPQWRLPFWTDVEHGSIFETVELAEAHLNFILTSQN